MVNVLLAIFGIALIVVLIQRKKSPELSRLLMVGLVVVLLILQGIKWFGGGSEMKERSQITYTFQSAAASVLGKQIAQDLDGGTIVVLQCTTDTKFSKSQIDGLKDGLGSGFDVQAVSVAEAGMTDMMTLEGVDVSIDMLINAIETVPGAVAAVSAIGMPFAEDGAIGNVPPLYVLESPSRGRGSSLLKRGIVRACVQYKQDVDWKAKPERGMSPEEIFAMRYALKTSD